MQILRKIKKLNKYNRKSFKSRIYIISSISWSPSCSYTSLYPTPSLSSFSPVKSASRWTTEWQSWTSRRTRKYLTTANSRPSRSRTVPFSTCLRIFSKTRLPRRRSNRKIWRGVISSSRLSIRLSFWIMARLMKFRVLLWRTRQLIHLIFILRSFWLIWIELICFSKIS